MSQIKEINQQILTAYKKSDPFYQALWGKEDFTPESEITTPNDYNCGAFANVLEYLYEYIRQLTNIDYTQLPDQYIDIVVYFFTGLRRFSGEPNEDLIRRMESLIIRECDWRSESFMTPWDILNVFCYYVERELLYYIPNSVENNLIVNGDFETSIGSEWVFDPSGDRSTGDSFTGSYKVDFADFQSVEQTVSVSPGSYILNSFVKPVAPPPEGFASMWDSGPEANASYLDQDFMLSSTSSGETDIENEIDVFNLSIQRDSDSKFFDTSDLTWKDSGVTNTFRASGNNYVLAEFFIVVDGTYDITIKFEKVSTFLLDRIELGLKEYPCFEILYIDEGIPEGFASMWGSGLQLENASYLDQDFMFSSGTSNYSDNYYQELLDMVKPAGVKGIWTREVKT